MWVASGNSCSNSPDLLPVGLWGASPGHTLDGMPDQLDGDRCPYGLVLPDRTSASRFIGGRRYPTRSDYERWMPSGGELASASDEHLARVVHHWHASGANGCAFAQWIAKRVDETEWPVVVMRNSDPLDLLNVGETLDFLARQSPAEMVSIVLPRVVDTEGVLAASDALATIAGFRLEDEGGVPTGFVGRRLRYTLPSGETAWVMAFGPFDWMPTTRQAPLLEFALRLKPKPTQIYWKLNQDRDVAHLADFPASLKESAWDRLFDLTLEETRRVLGEPPDELSAAKQTLAIPVEQLAKCETM